MLFRAASLALGSQTTPIPYMMHCGIWDRYVVGFVNLVYHVNMKDTSNINRDQTKTKHSKAQTICIIATMYHKPSFHVLWNHIKIDIDEEFITGN